MKTTEERVTQVIDAIDGMGEKEASELLCEALSKYIVKRMKADIMKHQQTELF